MPGLALGRIFFYYRYGGATTQWAFWVSWPDYDETVFISPLLFLSSFVVKGIGGGFFFESFEVVVIKGRFSVGAGSPHPRVTMLCWSLERCMKLREDTKIRKYVEMVVV